MAYDGEQVLVEGKTEGEWIVMVNPGTSDKQIHSMCQGAEHGCKLEGHPSEEQVISRSTACAKEQSMAASWKATPVRVVCHSSRCEAQSRLILLIFHGDVHVFVSNHAF